MWDAVFAAWKMSQHEVISGPYFPVFGLNIGKYGPEIIPYLDTFHAVFWKDQLKWRQNINLLTEEPGSIVVR